MRRSALAFLLLASVCASAQTASKTDSEVLAEARQAQEIYDAQKPLEALPLYEDLHAQRPKNTVYTERLASCLLFGSGADKPEDQLAHLKRARKLLLEAKAGGDNSALIDVLLEKTEGFDSVQPAAVAEAPVGKEFLDKAEAAFSKGDLQGALEFYKQAFAANPHYYAAALFAGDTEYKLNHPKQAGEWFAKAIALDPNIETAYRYWGDCLDKAGEHEEAKLKFIGAIVADPYSRTPRVGLKQWADHNHVMVVPPPIKLPAGPTKDKDGHITINVSPSPSAGELEMSLSMGYSMNRSLWQGDKFKKEFPKEKIYRHSLAEEADSIRSMLKIADELKIAEKKRSTTLKLLAELDKNGMLECWILLDNPDQGIAQDYVAYREQHRDLMAQYIAKYDLHPAM